ncbi:WD40-like Beta Propeller Repeat [Filimonas lacunae]|uniref:WD40-like Beta Propeller Repeat n=1 Tax=Filimonas lacunae TaxID=477680 RepID=A0A173MEN3_9BACT|nr:PD40 domain-containing protein [Filimonas lacunae]BAV05898.1 outer membrane lipoprotein omp16 precursor [Filimonas lacunae]SIT34550.1 WD40-like Beta Propeller Repeat [Filimonas lacunae]
MKQFYIIIAKIGVLCLLLLQCLPATADDVHNRILTRAIKAYKNLQYQEAAKLLKDVISYKKMSEDLQVEEMLAISLRKLDRVPDATFWYRKLVHSSDPKPSWFLHYAQLLASMELYDSAALYYGKYATLMPADKRGDAFAKAYANIADLKKGNKQFQVFFTNINTDASEYSPMFYKGGLLFTSNRRINGSVKNVYGWNKSPYSDIYEVDTLSIILPEEPDSLLADVRRNPNKYRSQLHALKTAIAEESPGDNRRMGFYDESMAGDTLGAISKIEGVHQFKGSVNSRFHEGSTSIGPDGTIYFTRSSHKRNNFGRSTDGVFRLQIFNTAKNDRGVEPFKYNDEDWSNAHPAVSKDGLFMIFTSDKPGSVGGTDLYLCTRDKITSQWNAPVNLGPLINTEGNEAFSYIDNNGTLFFASDGHPGLGGLDIFSIALNPNTHRPEGTVTHLGAPVNSPKDDFGFIWSDEWNKGYFSSNRRGNDDIYIVK